MEQRTGKDSRVRLKGNLGFKEEDEGIEVGPSRISGMGKSKVKSRIICNLYLLIINYQDDVSE